LKRCKKYLSRPPTLAGLLGSISGGDCLEPPVFLIATDYEFTNCGERCVNSMSQRPMFENMTTAGRVTLAKEKITRVVGHLLYVLELHENNAIALYSSTLSAQIPVSFAAHAFNVFQQGLHEIEIVRLCALWDQAKLKKENIPTVIKLIDDPDVIDSLAEGISAFWRGHQGGAPASAWPQSSAMFGEEQAKKARHELPKVIADGRKIMASPKLTSIMTLRDKHLAHSLSETWLEQKSGPIDPMRYGDEHELLDATVPIVDTLHCWVNGSNILFDESRRIARENAEALWTACKFKIDPNFKTTENRVP
jgi:hypothetical protein